MTKSNIWKKKTKRPFKRKALPFVASARQAADQIGGAHGHVQKVRNCMIQAILDEAGSNARATHAAELRLAELNPEANAGMGTKACYHRCSHMGIPNSGVAA